MLLEASSLPSEPRFEYLRSTASVSASPDTANTAYVWDCPYKMDQSPGPREVWCLRRLLVTHPRIPASHSPCRGHSNEGRRCWGWPGHTKAGSSCSNTVQSPERAVHQGPQWAASHKVNSTRGPHLTWPMFPGKGHPWH